MTNNDLETRLHQAYQGADVEVRSSSVSAAVLLARKAGGEKLSVLLGQDSGARDFFTDYGFAPAGTLEDGRTVFEKNIAFIPEFLGEYSENIDKTNMTSI